jgi:hypothetical protein
MTRDAPHGALLDVGTIRNDGPGVAIGGLSPGIMPWDAAHVPNRLVVPLRRPKNYGINSGIVLAKKYSL